MSRTALTCCSTCPGSIPGISGSPVRLLDEVIITISITIGITITISVNVTVTFVIVSTYSSLSMMMITSLTYL